MLQNDVHDPSPTLNPPPPQFDIPPPPQMPTDSIISSIVHWNRDEFCTRPVEEQAVHLCINSSPHDMEMLLHLSTYLIIGCFAILISFSAIVCAFRICYCQRSILALDPKCMPSDLSDQLIVLEEDGGGLSSNSSRGEFNQEHDEIYVSGYDDFDEDHHSNNVYEECLSPTTGHLGPTLNVNQRDLVDDSENEVRWGSKMMATYRHQAGENKRYTYRYWQDSRRMTSSEPGVVSIFGHVERSSPHAQFGLTSGWMKKPRGLRVRPEEIQQQQHHHYHHMYM